MTLNCPRGRINKMLSLNSLLSQASKINKAADKAASKWNDSMLENSPLTIDDIKNTEKRVQMYRLKKDILTMLELKNMIHQIEEETGEQLLFIPQGNKQAYFITIRPDTTKITFKDFFNQVKHFVDRRCFKEFKLSFEQKGTSEDTLGQGFHVHIVANMSQRSKGEVLRDTQNTFKDCTAPNCIQVLTTRNPQELVDKYLVNYESEDGHKAPTQEWDAKWRAANYVDPLYTAPLPIKSEVATVNSCITTISWN